MNRFAFYIIFYGLSTGAFAQGGVTPKNSSIRKVSVGISSSPDYCYRTLYNNDSSWSSDFVITQRNGYEVPKIGFTTGLQLGFGLTRHLELATGLTYSNKGYRTVIMDLTWIPPDSTRPERAQHWYSYHHADVPIIINMMAGSGSMRLLVTAGVVVNMMFSANKVSKLQYADGNTERLRANQGFDFNRLNISPALGIGVDFGINDHLGVRVAPTIRYGILKIINSPVTGRLWNVGVNVSCYLKKQ
jgi:hypothetical protein